jgi:acetoin utilization deacetylase AcuC-like enzyme
MKRLPVIYSEKYIVDLGTHVFRTEKYRLLKERILKEKLHKYIDFIEPEPCSDEELFLVHQKSWVEKIKTGTLSLQELYRLELPYSDELVRMALLSVGGTVLACRLAIKNGVSFHIGGGFHHAYPDHGEGFCALNDIGVGIRVVQRDGLIERGMVVDCDLHQGNGTAKIFENDPNVFTFSIHQEDNYPVPKERSSIDIGLYTGDGDMEYLSLLSKHFPDLYREFKPQLVIYVAGADPFEMDQLGGLKLSKKGLMERDRIVIEEAYNLSIPVAIVLGGGYSLDVMDTVDVHFNTFKIALQIFGKQIS